MILLFLALIISMILPIIVFNIKGKSIKGFKIALATNIVGFFGILIFFTVFVFGNVAMANPISDSVTDDVRAMAFLAAAIVTGLGTIGTGIATGQAAQAAIAAISENENLMGKSLIFVALAEGIAIYGLLIAFTILGRV